MQCESKARYQGEYKMGREKGKRERATKNKKVLVCIASVRLLQSGRGRGIGCVVSLGCIEGVGVISRGVVEIGHVFVFVSVVVVVAVVVIVVVVVLAVIIPWGKRSLIARRAHVHTYTS